MRWNRWVVSVAAATIAAGAYASGWNVNVQTSAGILNPGGVVVNVPFTVISNPLPQVQFDTALGNPNPILVGNGTFMGSYQVSDSSGTKGALSGFNFVVSGFVQGKGRIAWFKKVVDRNTSEILYIGSGVFLGGAYQGGRDGAITFTPSSHFRVRPTTSLYTRSSFWISPTRVYPVSILRALLWCSRTGSLNQPV